MYVYFKIKLTEKQCVSKPLIQLLKLKFLKFVCNYIRLYIAMYNTYLNKQLFRNGKTNERKLNAKEMVWKFYKTKLKKTLLMISKLMFVSMFIYFPENIYKLI